MTAIPIRDLFELSPRYLRSTNLERAFRDKRYLPLLITEAREPLGRAIVRALADLLDEHYQRGVKSGLQVRLRAAERKDRIADDDVLEMLREANEKLARDGRSAGLLVLLDVTSPQV